MIDIDRVRSESPACAHVIHLNNAGASLPPDVVTDAVVDYLRQEAAQGGYEVAAARASDLANFDAATAKYLGCTPQEVAFVTSASDGWWRAFSALDIGAGDRILVGRSEFQANAFGWLRAQDLGAEVTVIDNDVSGTIDLQQLSAELDERVKLVSLTMISMSNGAIHPAAEVGKVVADSSAFYLLDACQAAGQLPLDVDTLGCDALVYTGRKFMRGPRGTATLYVREASLDHLVRPVMLDGRSAIWHDDGSYGFAPGAKRFEFGEVPYAGRVGLGVATDYMVNLGIDAIASRIRHLSARLRSGLESIDGVRVLDEGDAKSGIVTFDADGLSCAHLQATLSKAGINVSAPGRGNAQLDLGARGIDAVIRAGVHYYNTDAELDRLLHVVSETTA